MDRTNSIFSPPRCRPPSQRCSLVQPPHRFRTFKYETPEATEGRKKVKDLGDDVKVHEKRVKVRIESRLILGHVRVLVMRGGGLGVQSWYFFHGSVECRTVLEHCLLSLQGRGEEKGGRERRAVSA